jgi:hypothetical protein
MRRITMILVLAVALPCPAPAVAQTYAAGERPYAPGDCPNLRGERRENGTVPFAPAAIARGRADTIRGAGAGCPGGG